MADLPFQYIQQTSRKVNKRGFVQLCTGNDSLDQVLLSLFMTVLGVLNMITSNGRPRSLVTVDQSALLRLVFNFLLNFGVALLDPLVISIGMLFGMPLGRRPAVVKIVGPYLFLDIFRVRYASACARTATRG
uniref:PGG domain-containing protein n=1 Tax=Globodera pallida TaxID=36090 RepID=A0A183CI20_GLOPA